MPMLFSQRHDLADKVEKRIAQHERAMRRNRVISVPPISIARTTANIIGILEELGWLREKPEPRKTK